MLPTLAVAPVTLVGNGEIAPIVQLKLLAALAVSGKLKAPQVVADVVAVITGVGFTVMTTEAATPVQLPTADTGVTRYCSVLATVLLAFTRGSVISPPELVENPEILFPGFDPIVHDMLLGVVTFRNRSTFMPLQMLLPVTVIVGVVFTTIEGLVTTVGLLQPTPV